MSNQLLRTCRSRPVLCGTVFAATLLFTVLSSAAEPLVQTPQETAIEQAQLASDATALTPVGTWYTIHDETKKATSVVRIAWEGDQLVGRVVEVLASNRGPNPLCERCDGERRNKPVVGMSILWNLRGSKGSYEGGTVLDPSRGKQYRAKVKMRDHNTLELRGYLGISAFGRTQVWQRVPTKTEAPVKAAACTGEKC